MLILGSDQDREDWHQTLQPFGLAQTIEEDGEWSTVRLHEHLELWPLEAGLRLNADGLGLVRSRADVIGSGLLVIADSLARLLPEGVDEDKAAAAGPVYGLVEALGDAWGLLLHHTRKAAGKEQNLGVGAGRGSGAVDAAVSRVIGLGLVHRMEHGQMVADEASPERELLSTKRGGPTVHLVVRMDAEGWSLVGDAGEHKRQRQREHQRRSLTKEQHRVLEALDGQAGQFLTTRQVAEGMKIDWEADVKDGKPKAAALRKQLRRLADLGLVEHQRVGKENTYRSVPGGGWEEPYESPEREEDTERERRRGGYANQNGDGITAAEAEDLEHLHARQRARRLEEDPIAAAAGAERPSISPTRGSVEPGSLGSPVANTGESPAPLPAPIGSHRLPSSEESQEPSLPPDAPDPEGSQREPHGSHQGSRSEAAPGLKRAKGATPWRITAHLTADRFQIGNGTESRMATRKQLLSRYGITPPPEPKKEKKRRSSPEQQDERPDDGDDKQQGLPGLAT
ncbi:helicase RepA family protein [Cyanobium sp. LEGE 06113]|uniref:helicase RepA family protein n=1 Tax=Cyanobium sp. LEGE 06113 TaxID=1297573 RepID=UPI001D138CD9|nr:helicase RepA family protein [Cyanobium sp. LEGE 06113]